MANITVRTSTTATDPSSTSAKGSALSHTELDSNFILLNNEKLENTGTPDLTGSLQVKGSGGSAVGAVRFFDNDDSNYVELKSPATVGSNETFILPAADGSTGQFLKTDGSGNLSFATVSGGGSGDITSVVAGAGLTGGATTGDATLNVIAGTGIDVAADAVSVDVSDFLTNGVNNRVVTATGADAMNSETNLTFDGSVLGVAGTQTITNTTTSDSLTIATTEASATAAPVVSLKRNSASPADNDFIGAISFKGEDDADAEIEYASIKAKIVDVTSSGSSQDGNLEFNALGTNGQMIFNNNAMLIDDKYLHFGSEFDAYIGWDNSSKRLVFESRDYGTSSSGKGDIRIRADNKVELFAGRDRDGEGDIELRAFDEFQFRKGTSYAKCASDVQATTNGTTSVTLNRALSQGEINAFEHSDSGDSLYFYDNTSFSNSARRNMDNYIQVTGKGSGSTPTLTLASAVSNLSNATHTGRHLMFESSAVVVNVDGARGNHDAGAQFVLENRIGEEGPQDRSLVFKAKDFHNGEGFFEPGSGVSDEEEHSPVTYDLGIKANENTLTLTHSTMINDSTTDTTVFKARGRASTTSTIGSETAPQVFQFGINPQLPSYAVAALPGSALAGEIAFCTNETGGAVMVFSDGTNWRRCTDRAVASA